MMCLDERRLLALRTGDGTRADREHLDSCRLCASRMQVLRRDLARIETVFATPPPRIVRVERRAARWAPVVIAAGLALAVAIERVGPLARVPGDDGPTLAATDDDTVTLADELVDAMATDVPFDDGATDPTEARSTCAWGDPLLAVGCDEPAVTQIAWR